MAEGRTGGPPFSPFIYPSQENGCPILCGERGFGFALGAKGGITKDCPSDWLIFKRSRGVQYRAMPKGLCRRHVAAILWFGDMSWFGEEGLVKAGV
jgi:hypothetical protein